MTDLATRLLNPRLNLLYPGLRAALVGLMMVGHRGVARVVQRTRRRLQPLVDHLPALVAVAYVAVILAIWRLAWPAHAPDRNYLAAHRLVNNHRIVAGDLQPPDRIAESLGFYMPSIASVEGKYIRSASVVMPGRPVTAAMLGDRPDMRLPGDMRALVFPLPVGSRLAGLLDAGTTVVLLGQDSNSKAAVSVPATVHAMLCDANNAADCYPILCIPADRLPFVLENLAAVRLVLRPDP